MKTEDILKFYDDLNRLAASRCESRYDAEELVSETMLAAVAFVSRGGIIEHPKTWLANTLMHKYNDSLRRRYRRPVIVNLDNCVEIPGDDAEAGQTMDCSEEYAKVRQEVSYLARITREALILYYFGGNSVEEIAGRLQIPVGTVKSRLAAGRDQVRKGLDTMDIKDNYLPGKLYLSYAGSSGAKNEPMSLVEDDLIAQNLLILAYGKPLYMGELSRMIGIPAAYIEPIVDRLVDGELMVCTDGGKYYTDFLIYKKEDELRRFDGQLKFVEEHFDVLWGCMDELITGIRDMEFGEKLNQRQLRKLERYAVLRVLQAFFQNRKTEQRCPDRRDGGCWAAVGVEIPAGYDEGRCNKADEYVVFGGHRTSGGKCDYNGAGFLQLCEFDTSLLDEPRRFLAGGPHNYFVYITKLLWCIRQNVALTDSEIPNEMLEGIPQLEAVGLLSSESGKVTVDIPVLDRKEYKGVEAAVGAAVERLKKELGDELGAFLKCSMLQVPAYLKNVLDVHRLLPATRYLVMAAVRKAYEKGLHLQDVDYCCPPVVLVFEEK